MRIRNRLKEIMKETGTSVRQLAAAIGSNKTMIQKIRDNEETERERLYARICEYYGIDICELLYLSDEDET